MEGEMTNRQLTFAGHSAVFLEFGSTVVGIDPWLKGNPLCPPALIDPKRLDVIVLTHGHADHASDVVRVQKKTDAVVAATYELAMILVSEGVPADRVIPMNKGGRVEVGGIQIRLTNAYHSSSYDSAKGPLYAGEACGALITGAGATVFHAGDTSLFSDLKLIGELHRPDVALLPIGDRFTMGPTEAAIAASWLHCKIAIPIHYNTFELLTGTYEEFSTECKKRAITTFQVAPGESIQF
jgi:L-ascorbate metabolism protein UlaG (beta-lactamase superfamily)